MKLKKLLTITKAKSYLIFVYDTKKRGIHDSPLAVLQIKGKDHGAGKGKTDFLDAKVLKIIPDGNKVNIVCYAGKNRGNKYIKRKVVQ